MAFGSNDCGDHGHPWHDAAWILAIMAVIGLIAIALAEITF